MVKEKKIKKYRTPYIIFVQEEIKKMKNINLNIIEKMKIIGKNWKKLSIKEKEKYIKESELDKEKFNTLKESGIKYKYKKKKNIIIRKIKRFRTAFMFFLHDKKKNIDKKNSVDSLRKIAKEWKEMNLEKKKIYYDFEKEDKIRYEKELMIKMENEIKSKKTKEQNKEQIKKLMLSIEKIYEDSPHIINTIKKKFNIKDFVK